MSTTEKPAPPSPEDAFRNQAEQRPVGLLREFYDFLRYNKAWWLTPIIIVVLLVGALMFLAATSVAPFLYPFI